MFSKVEIIHFLLALCFAIVINTIYKSKYKELAEDKFIERIVRDKTSFTDNISLVILCMVLTLVFSADIHTIFKWTLDFLMVTSFGQYLSYTKSNKDLLGQSYKKIIEAVDVLVIVDVLAIIFSSYVKTAELIITGCVMAVFTVVSLCALYRLNQIEKNYFSEIL